MLYDVFICHASEDKDSFVRPLAELLKENHLEVWYDEFSLSVGDSLRVSIDKGLLKSRYGIVVLSPEFFKKRWTERELNGLVAREMADEMDLILPIWHNLSKDELLEYSPPLADKVALDSKHGVEYVCDELKKKLRPHESPLIVARDELIYFGLSPPVISDEWWLNVVEASNRISNFGFSIPEQSTWGRWTFPLPNFDSYGEDRGVRLAWTAMQMEWEKQAEGQKITQITHPKKVLEFIRSMPGLSEMCHDYPGILAAYAPQLTINDFSEEFSEDFDDVVQNGKIRLPLRNINFLESDAVRVACDFVQGDIGGPHCKHYEVFDYLVWFLSTDSKWLPKDICKFLIKGMREWSVWQTSINFRSRDDGYLFIDKLFEYENAKQIKEDKKAISSLKQLINHSLNVLEIRDDSDEILSKFIHEKFIEQHFINDGRRKKS